MALLQRVVAGVVMVCFTLASTGVAFAQSPAPAAVVPDAPVVAAAMPAAGSSAPVSQAGQSAPAAQDDSMAAGLLDGEALAESHSTGGKLAAGLGVGVLTGLIGTGIGYFVIGPSELSPEVLQRGTGRSADYQLGLKTGYERKMRSRKRNAFLAGGLLGTAAFIAMVAASGSGQ